MSMEEKRLSKTKLRAFKLMAFLLPVIVLFLVEGALRLFGYGHDTALFIQYPDNHDYWVMNKYASQRYFSDTVNETRGNIEPFRINKTANTFRIFVLGESTTAGYPYVHNGSFHRWLQYRLERTYPDINFEVVNVSLTAVNSYTVLDFGKQVLDYQPDAVLIYTGHNEYYGALGVGSTSNAGNNRVLVKTLIQLRRSRLVQLIGSLVGKLKNGGAAKIDERETLMKRMAANQEIPYNSPEYKAGIRQFTQNIGELCDLMQKKNIPVFLSNLVSNEKDLTPFTSKGTGNVNAADQFALAKAAYAKGDYNTAKQLFIKARDLDLLRFRAPEDINNAINTIAAKHSIVHLVDARTSFSAASPQGILGNETLLEHVHPNLYGYALLSDAFYKSIQKANLIKSKSVKSMPFADLLIKMPVTKVDSLYGAYTVMMLESGWPFNKPIPQNFKRGNSLDEQLAGAMAVNRITWSEAMNQLFQASMHANDKKTALKAVEATMLDNPLNITYKIFAGRISLELGDPENTLFCFKKAYSQEPSFENLQNLYIACLKTDSPEEAVSYLKQAIEMHPQDASLPQILEVAHQIIELKTKLNSIAENDALKREIAIDYHHIGADEAAAKYN
ncbi:SGNH/GDSL hydrolase family protein [Mucilaginibacter agri]|uniref:SGNH hydrolase-type esterase domain-containing protein n=1 Tax=Mucilaginibacter agri TaxID=2695265 RepID=A0A965ZDR4_9SPHI|nr:SGNH/GDSL hydrolase family protein [Mucilaginibacter agri]NCD68144.1 hypothetical protein [Mucilaginibacter agri]